MEGNENVKGETFKISAKPLAQVDLQCLSSHCDLELVSKERKVLRAHRSLLSRLSPLIRNWILQTTGDNTNQMYLPDYGEDIIKICLKIIYFGSADTSQTSVEKVFNLAKDLGFGRSVEFSVLPNCESDSKTKSQQMHRVKEESSEVFDDRADVSEESDSDSDSDGIDSETSTIVIDKHSEVNVSKGPARGNMRQGFGGKSRQRGVKRRENYDVEQLNKALEAIRAKKMSVAGAAEMFEIPRTTLRNWNSGKNKQWERLLPKPISFMCSLCGKEFKEKKLLCRHEVIVHTSDTKFSCLYCEKQYRNKGGLEQHVQIVHKNIKKFQCDFCGLQFGQKPHLNRHCHNIHPEEMVRLNTDEDVGAFVDSYICQKCGQKFKHRERLKLHMMAHNNEKPYQCVLCNVRANRKDNVQLHVKKEHGHKTNLDKYVKNVLTSDVYVKDQTDKSLENVKNSIDITEERFEIIQALDKI